MSKLQLNKTTIPSTKFIYRVMKQEKGDLFRHFREAFVAENLKEFLEFFVNSKDG